MSKISRALEKAQKERAERQNNAGPNNGREGSSPLFKGGKGGFENNDRSTQNPSSPPETLPLKGETNDGELLQPRIHDPELVRLKVRRRSPHHPSVKREKQLKMMFLIVLALVILFSIMAYIYVQINQDPFELIDPGTEQSDALTSPLARGESDAQSASQGGFEDSEPGSQNPSALRATPLKRGDEKAPAEPLPSRGDEKVLRTTPLKEGGRTDTGNGSGTSLSRDVVVAKVTVVPEVPDVVQDREVVRAPVIVPVATSKVIATFNSGTLMNEIGGVFFTWSEDVKYPCNNIFDDIHARMGTGYALKLSYNIESTGTVRNGLAMDLAGIPTQDYATFSFYMKGDNQSGFSKAVVVSLESSHRKLLFGLNNVTYRWEKVSVPLKDYDDDGEILKEFRLIFQSDLVTAGAGTVYIDDVALEK